MTAPALGELTSAIVDALEAGASLLVGDAVRPAGGGWQGAEGASTFTCYAVVYPLPAVIDGDLDGDLVELEGVWQVTSVGPTRAATQAVADDARRWLLSRGRRITTPGRVVMRVTHDGGGEVRRDDSTSPALFYGVDRYRFQTTPTR